MKIICGYCGFTVEEAATLATSKAVQDRLETLMDEHYGEKGPGSHPPRYLGKAVARESPDCYGGPQNTPNCPCLWVKPCAKAGK